MLRIPRKKRILFLACVVFIYLLLQWANVIPSELSLQQEENKAVEGLQSANEGTKVTKVIDGDTIEVLQNGKKEKVRIIGINAPESVDPRRGVECFGREASAFAKERLLNQSVRLEADPTQSERDRYGRLLRYVWIDGKLDFGKLAISEGFAYEYTYNIPYKYQVDYTKAEKEARETTRGLWADKACAK